ncbi:unnamed protein product [Symbiodinium sp. CCMP2592]|nr:unnamed protein product [Symbiodinium sp. CCMP2592]
MTPVPGLESWLNERSLSKYLQSVMFWCHDKGVSNLQEILLHLNELSDELSMKTFEKRRLLKGPPRLGLMRRVDEAAADGAWSDESAYGRDTSEEEYDRPEEDFDPGWESGPDYPDWDSGPDYHDDGWDYD